MHKYSVIFLDIDLQYWNIIYIGSEMNFISYGIYETSCVFYIP